MPKMQLESSAEACVAKLARSPNGTDVVSKFLSSNPTAAPMLVSALLPEVACLASHPYGAGVVSELLCHCQDLKLSSAVKALSSCLKGSLVRLTKDRFGCRVVQAALREAMPEFQQCFVSELQGQVLSLCQHLHANFVLQKCIELLEPHLGVFMITELKDHAVSVAVHVYGCRVLQRLIEHCSREPQLIDLVDSMLGNAENVEKLLKDLFGSNVLRALLVHGTVHHVKAARDAMWQKGFESHEYSLFSSRSLRKCYMPHGSFHVVCKIDFGPPSDINFSLSLPVEALKRHDVYLR